jgi:hypothetical protein
MKSMLSRLPKSTERKLARLKIDKERSQRSEDAKLLSSLGASKGGIARSKSLTSDRRQEIAINAAKARWEIK